MNFLGYPLIYSALYTLTHSSSSHCLVEHCVDAAFNKMVTTEDLRALLMGSSISFLDTKVTCKWDGSLSTNVYRKPTHTDHYMPPLFAPPSKSTLVLSGHMHLNC